MYPRRSAAHEDNHAAAAFAAAAGEFRDETAIYPMTPLR